MGTRLLVTLAAAGFSAAITACGSSTAPPQTNPAVLAAEFDTLANHEFCDEGPGVNPPLCQLIFAAHMGVAEGVAPTPIRVSTSAGSENWLGYAYLFRYAGRVAGSIDSVYGIVAYDGVDLRSVVSIYVPVNWSPSYAVLDSTGWSTQAGAPSGTGAASVLSVGDQCENLDPYPLYRPPFIQQDCRYATIRVSVEVTLYTNRGNDSMTISIPSQTMSGFVLDTGAFEMRSHDARNSGKVR